MSHKSPVVSGQRLQPVPWGLSTGSRWAGPRGAWPGVVTCRCHFLESDLPVLDGVWGQGTERDSQMTVSYGELQVREEDRGGG